MLELLGCTGNIKQLIVNDAWLNIDESLTELHKALFADKSSCASASIAITHPENGFKNIHALRKNINTVAMLTGDAFLLL